MNTPTKNVVLGGLAVLIVILLGLYFYNTKHADNSIENPIACTMEAKQCPDGSYVGRQGPNCEFAQCPVATSTQQQPVTQDTTVTANLNHQASTLGVTITPLAVVEDSRCPVGVQCIQAGTVKVRATVSTGAGISTQVFMLHTPIQISKGSIELVDVTPVPTKGVKLKTVDYRFVFRVIQTTNPSDIKG